MAADEYPLPVAPPPMMLRLRGKRDTTVKLESIAERYYEIEEAYSLGDSDRGSMISHEARIGEEVIGITTEQGVEWFGLGDDLPELTGQPTSRGRDGQIFLQLPRQLAGPGVSRGGGVGLVIKSFLKIGRRIVGKIAGAAAEEKAERIALDAGRRIDERQCSRPGLHLVNNRGKLVPITKAIPTDQPVLIFIHGTISNFTDGFGGILPGYWQQLHDKYGGQVYAFNHKTITDSPVKNALDLLGELPDGITFDLMTHSRGGLVGDVLARCDNRLQDEKGYTAVEIAAIRAEVDAEGAENGIRLDEELEALNAAADKKTVTLRRIVRVACPAAGTTLLSERLDHFVNALFNVAKYATGGTFSPILGLLRTFVIAVVDERSDPTTFPGLYAMVPGRGFSRINNNNFSLDLPSELFNVAGNSETGKPSLQALKVLLGNLYYWQANDLVVDTASMSRGVFGRRSNTTLRITTPEVDHFSYFDEEKYMKLITRLLISGGVGDMVQSEETSYTETFPDRTDHGVLVDKLYSLGTLEPAVISGDKPIVFLLPGVMGSNLSADNDRKWVRVKAIAGGAMVDDLGPDAKNVTANSVSAKYYQELTYHLSSQGYDVRVFPYDWRQSVTKAASLLDLEMEAISGNQQSVSIIAHSMGGLVARQWMFDYRDRWTSFRDTRNLRVILLGVPWRGSHLITEVLTGHSKRVKQLHLMDLRHNKRELLDALSQLEGLIELLPLDDGDVSDKGWWEMIEQVVGDRHMAPIRSASLDHLADFKDKVQRGLDVFEDKDWASIIYVAGQAPETVDGHVVTYSLFRRRGKLRYLSTSRGDGSVTWKRGIPEKLPEGNLYYTRTQHGKLPDDDRLFAGLTELIEKGTTRDSAFLRSAPAGTGSRGDGGPEQESVRTPTAVSDRPPVDVLMGIEEEIETTDPQTLPLHVEVFNGDLKWAKFPVLVGHFEHDGIVSAERAIDNYLGNILSERHLMGFYPGKIGEQDVIIDHRHRPRGTIVVGLGDKDDLTGFSLAKTVEKGILKYAIFLRDNEVKDTTHPGDGHGVSVLFIGSNYGQLPLAESLRSVLIGIRQANEVIASFNSTTGRQDLLPIRVVEFVDYYEDRAYEAYKSLQDMSTRMIVPNLRLAPSISPGFGKRRRFLRDGSRSWWQTFTTTLNQEISADGKTVVDEKLEFSTYNRGSSVSTDRVESNLTLARFLAEELSTEPRWDPDDAKVLFEMLIPNRYKDFIRNHRNVAWRMDPGSAAFPWEMFHDVATGDEPTFVRAGMIRQLQSERAEIRPTLVRENRALVIANPQFSKRLPDLPEAEKEGLIVARALGAHGYEVIEEIDTAPLPIIKSLFAKRYKIIHVASHGIFDPEDRRTGIAIGKDQFITPGTLKQITAIPELVFVNCCYLGKIDAGLEEYRQSRHRLAANIGTQLIDNGVKAVVVAGWAVDDAAARTFAEVFYGNILEGEYFGEAVRLARKACYDHHGTTNTWGAYQCYGDPFYRCSLGGGSKKEDDALTLDQEVVLELDNLISSAESVSGDGRAQMLRLSDRVDDLIRQAENQSLSSPEITEREAKFYTYVGQYEAAADRYETLFAPGHGQYRVRSFLDYLEIQARRYAADENLSDAEAFSRIEAVIGQLDDLKISDAGPTKNTILGSAYKRAAARQTKSEARKYLKKSADKYLEAAHQIGIRTPSAIYQTCGFLTLSCFCNAGVKDRIDITEELGMTPKQYYDLWRNEASYLGLERDSAYAQLRGANLALSELVYKSFETKMSKSAMDKATEELIVKHAEQLEESFNLRDLHGQLEHLDILLKLCTHFGSSSPHLSKNLLQMKRLLNAYIL